VIDQRQAARRAPPLDQRKDRHRRAQRRRAAASTIRKLGVWSGGVEGRKRRLAHRASRSCAQAEAAAIRAMKYRSPCRPPGSTTPQPGRSGGNSVLIEGAKRPPTFPPPAKAGLVEQLGAARARRRSLAGRPHVLPCAGLDRGASSEPAPPARSPGSPRAGRSSCSAPGRSAGNVLGGCSVRHAQQQFGFDAERCGNAVHQPARCACRFQAGDHLGGGRGLQRGFTSARVKPFARISRMR
jgi:hypothetical protein